MFLGIPHDQREQRSKGLTCTPWFAWHPVRLEDGRWCWLESIWRRWECDALTSGIACGWSYSQHPY